ncbi:MAG: lytic transglycosylase domain-containing protein [Christensenellales bacterium]|nr:lytic transglycosylase domain-containing protein [Clostridiales bacterium]
MSENTPMRRRRPPQPVQIDDASIPHKSDEDNPVRPAREMPPHRRVRVVPIETTDDDAPRHLPESPLSSLPTPVRFGALALALILLIVGSVSITRTYLAHQEERRRLEAEAAERAQHPLYYADTITAYADAQELDPALVAAVILCESSYDPKAESRLGARGLMQLMPDTAEWVAHKLGEDGADYSFDNLYDPQTNIRFGTWYLGYLSRRFNGDATKIVCAYHAGQGNVDSWLKNPQYSSDGVTLDVIPTQDTATYASRVLRARDIYRKYYFPIELPDTQQTETES